MQESDRLERLKGLSPERRALLLKTVRKVTAARQETAAIARRDQHSPAPLSFSQQRLWLLDQLAPGSSAYNIASATRLTGQFDAAALQRSLKEVVWRHETLRTTFATVDGVPVQVIAPVARIVLPLIDLCRIPSAHQDAQVQRLAGMEAHLPFDLARGPLIRGILLRLTEAEHVLLLTMHHIVADGWSIGVLIGELARLYTAFAAGRPSPLPELPIQYADYAVWQRAWLQGPGVRGQGPGRQGDKETRRQGDKETDVDERSTQNSKLKTQNSPLHAQLAYWQKQLADLPVLQLPSDYPRPPVQTFRGTTHPFILPTPLQQALNALAQREEVTLFMLLLAAFEALLQRYSGQDVVVVGAPIANRTRRETEGLIGFFVNTLALRSSFAGDPPFQELLRRVRETTLEAYAHQDVPFEMLVEKLQPARDLSRTPLFQVAFALQHASATALTLPGLTLTPLAFSGDTAKFDLTLLLVEGEAGLKGELEYSTDLFAADMIERFVVHFQTLLESIVADLRRRISALPLLTTAERRHLLVECNATGVAYPETPIHRLIEVQVARTPEAIALVFDGPSSRHADTQTRRHADTGSERSAETQPPTPNTQHPTPGTQRLTYAELNRLANQLACHLCALGAGPEVIVGLYAERSVELVIGLLATLKAGASFLPLDPDYPVERLHFMIADARPAVLLTQARLLDTLPEHTATVVCLDRDWPLVADLSGDDLPVEVHGDNLAYVIYTSGSTGRPKGALNTQRGISNRLLWMQDRYRLDGRDAVLQKTPFSFDVSVWEFFWPLLAGARLVLARPGDHRDPAYLAQLIAEQEITTLHFVPSMLQVFLEVSGVEERCAGLRRVICSGEALQSDLQERFLALMPGQLHNLYGPTEAAIDVTYWACEPVGDRRSVPIGYPIANTQVYVLDDHMQPVPVGVPGELYLGGVGLGRGYLYRPELTAERFIPNPFGDTETRRQGDKETGNDEASTQNLKRPEGTRTQNLRLYRTGDLARYRSDGAIEFLGRLDHQVKLRGMRIELGEIEAVLSEHPAVREAVVLARAEPTGAQRLVAYLVPDDRHAPVVKQLLRFEKAGLLADRSWYELPNGMVVVQRNKGETDFVYQEIFEEQEYLRHGIALHDGDCVFDVGANIGLFSLFVGQSYKNAAIYAFEPIAPVFEMLRLNAGLYNLDIRLFECGLSNEARTELFTYYPHLSIMSGRFSDESEDREVVRLFMRNQLQSDTREQLLEEVLADRLTAEQVTCSLRTISEIIREHDVQRIDLLKIDVEKSELDILSGIQPGDWPKIRQIVVEVHDIDGRLDRISGLLRSQGYELTIDQQELLRHTGLYTLYAIRPSTANSAARRNEHHGERAAGPFWYSPGALIAGLRTFLHDQLPEYMVPSAFVPLDALPLTPNGKLDRRALPAPAEPHDAEHEFVAPRDQLELELAHLWEDLLGIKPVGVRHNFFALGGHSLLAAQLMAHIQRTLGYRLPLSALFQGATIEQLAVELRRQRDADEPMSCLVPLQKGQAGRQPLFLIHPVGGNVVCYQHLVRHLESAQPVYGLQAQGLDGRLPPYADIEAMAGHYLRLIRTVQPQGPYRLAGWSFGGVVAFEIARQLQAQGQEVDRLVLIDSFVAPGDLASDPDPAALLAYFAADLGLAIAETRRDPAPITDWGSDESLAWFLAQAKQAHVMSPDIEIEHVRHLWQVYQSNRQVLKSYRPRSYSGSVWLFKACERADGASQADDLGWGDWIAQGLSVHTILGDHYSLLRPPSVTGLAEALRELLSH